MAAMVLPVHPTEGILSGCRTCGCKFKRFSHRKKVCQRCGDSICSRCLIKSPSEVTRRVREVKKFMCQTCNALVIVPFISETTLSRTPTPQLVLYLDHHQVQHSHLVSRPDMERLVSETRRGQGRPDRETITGPHSSWSSGSRRSQSRSENNRQQSPRSQSGLRRGSGPEPRGSGRMPHPSITNLLLAEHLLGQLLMTIDGGGGGQAVSDEAYQAQQQELRESHKKAMERQRIASKLQTAKSEAEFREMRVADLKTILEVNHVDHSMVIEKEELLAKVIDLWESTKVIDNMTNKDRTCKICMDAPSDCVFLECGHLVTCVTCGEQLDECPMCRSPIVRAVRVFET